MRNNGKMEPVYVSTPSGFTTKKLSFYVPALSITFGDSNKGSREDFCRHPYIFPCADMLFL